MLIKDSTSQLTLFILIDMNLCSGTYGDRFADPLP